MFSHLKYLFLIVLFSASLHGENFSFSELLKECKPEQAVALQELNDFLGLNETTQFQTLEGGLTRARVYSFEVEKEKFVLRFLALIPSHSKEMRQNEIQALKIGHKLGIAPPCLFSDQNSLLMVMPLINGHPLRQPKERQLIQLGKMIAALHHYSDPYPTRYTLKERLELHYKKGIKAGVAYPTGFEQEVRAVLSKPCSPTLVPCHGDLNPSNILVDDSNDTITIIDWTTATLADPFTDLSYFCLLSNLSTAQEKIFLKAYFGRTPLEKEYEILREEKAKVFLLTATLWLRFSETVEDQALPLESRISALDAELYSSNLKPAQDYLREGVVIDLNTAPKSAIKSYALSFYKAYLQAKATG